MTHRTDNDEQADRIEREEEYPLIRHIEAVPVSIQGAGLIMLRDPAMLTLKIIVVPADVFFIISHFDGNHSLGDIQEEYAKKFGKQIPMNKIREIIAELDGAMLLENERYRQYMDFLQAEFKKQEFRESSLAGKGYPSDPVELRQELDLFFEDLPADRHPQEIPVGAAAPHIDYERGSRVYGIAYREIKKAPVDLFIIFGTSHHDVKNFVALTGKTFRTPLGDLPVDTGFLDALTEKCETDFFAGEYAHRGEHSIELQTVLLKYLYPERDIKILPILVSSFDDFESQGKMPMDVPQVKEFINAMRETLKEQGKKVFFLAGIDFAHIGLAFGDPTPPTMLQMKSLEEDELKTMKFIENMDGDGFFKDVIGDQARRKVCGLSPLYLMMKCMDASHGKLLQYRQCNDPQGMANVTIAALGFYGGEQ